MPLIFAGLPKSQIVRGVRLQRRDTSQKNGQTIGNVLLDVYSGEGPIHVSRLIRRLLRVGIVEIDATVANSRTVIGTFVSHFGNPTGSCVCVYATGPRRTAEEWIVWAGQEGGIMEAVLDKQTDVYTHRYFLRPDAIPEEIARAALSALLRWQAGRRCAEVAVVEGPAASASYRVGAGR